MGIEHNAGLKLRLLGRTGIKIGEIGFGAWAFGYGDTSDDASLEALAVAFDAGINFVDTADAYGMGRSESLVGQAMKVAPRRIHVATKVGTVRRDSGRPIKNFSAEYVKSACERSLERLGITNIDLYQLHNPPRNVIAGNEIWETLRELQDKNKILHYGICINEPGEGILAIDKGEVDAIQVVYNPLNRVAAAELFNYAEKKSVGVIVREPLANGLLTGKYKPGHRFAENDFRRTAYPRKTLRAILERAEKLRPLCQKHNCTMAQLALKYCLSHPSVSVAIPGIKTAAQVTENLAAALLPEFTAEEMKFFETV